MTVSPGSRLGPYEITAKLGEGGMGEVWRATDSRLRRDVALKVLPAAFTEDKERLARFEREAQLLAQLQHPNIASIYGLEESDGVRALVMELVGGDDLSTIIARGPLAIAEALPLARQIAEALEAAHERGIVHRDLKPQNVKVLADGTVKVLDFGLAKAMDSDASAASAADLARSPTLMNSPTLTAVHGTQLGVILGTAAYMAPEQARGGAVDKRADIWAFGVVLYEMLCGRSLFAADTVSDTLAGVLKTEIDFSRLPAATPFAVKQLLARCLERNPKNRLHDIADARIALDEVLSGRAVDPSPSAATANPASARARWSLALGALVLGLLVGGAVVAWRASRAGDHAVLPAQLTEFAIRAPEGTSFVRGLALSPDGRKIAFTARHTNGHVTLWVRTLDSLEARELAETDDARYPFWAPDSRRIGFFSQRNLKWIDSVGGTPVVVTRTSSIQDVRGGTWGADDRIVYAPTFTGPLFIVAASGGASAPASRLPESGEIGTMRFPCFLPDGKRFLFYASAGTGTEPGKIFLGRVGSLDAKLLGPAHSMALYAPPGYLIYARGESLVAHRFDSVREELVGEPEPIPISMGGSLNFSGLRSVGIASTGALAYRSDKRNASQLFRVDRAGRELEAISDATSAWHYAPRLSPDNHLLLDARYSGQEGLGEIWVSDLERRLTTRLTFDSGDDYLPVWIRPGSREILYNSGRPKAAGSIYRGALDRPGEEALWLASERNQSPDAVTPDGRRVVFERSDERAQSSLWIRDLDGDSAPTRLTSATSNENSADVSPDGRWLAFASDATRSWEVYVRRLDGSGGSVRISNEGGFQPLWRRDGKELFYVDSNGRLVATPITLPSADGSADLPRPGLPAPLFEARLEESTDRQYDATADGQQFVLNRSVANDTIPIIVVLDWTALLEKKTP